MLATTLLPVLLAAGFTADARQPAPNTIRQDAAADHRLPRYFRDTSPRIDALPRRGFFRRRSPGAVDGRPSPPSPHLPDPARSVRDTRQARLGR
jgi:hypothetical protein